MSSPSLVVSGFVKPAALEHGDNQILFERQRSLGEGPKSVSSPALGKKALSLGEKQHNLGSPTAPYVRLNVLDFKQSSSVATLGNTRESQRIRGHRGQSSAWWAACPPPDILRRLWRVAVGYAFCITVSLALINWAMHRLPSTEQLASQVEKDPASMVLRVPRSFGDLQAVHSTLEAYRGLYFSQLMLLYGLVFLFMQVFIVPGCFFVTILLGSLIPIVPAVAMVTILTTVGCVVNYEVSKYLLADVLLWMFPKRVGQFQEAVLGHQSNLFNYLLFLRSVPLLPSWLVNVGSPLAKVPLCTFIASTVLGFQPQYIILVTGGKALTSLHSWRDLYQWQAIVGIAVCGILSLLPIGLKRMAGPEYGKLPEHKLPR